MRVILGKNLSLIFNFSHVLDRELFILLVLIDHFYISTIIIVVGTRIFNILLLLTFIILGLLTLNLQYLIAFVKILRRFISVWVLFLGLINGHFGVVCRCVNVRAYLVVAQHL